MTDQIVDDSDEVSVNFVRLSPLVGRWRGAGTGEFPSIEPFSYVEELRCTVNDSECLIHFEQRTWRKSANGAVAEPLHWESGFIRPIADGTIEISNAQNGGRVEVLRGRIIAQPNLPGDLVISFESVLLGNDPRLLGTRRTFTVKDDLLEYVVEMATVKTPEYQPHLRASLMKLTGQ